MSILTRTPADLVRRLAQRGAPERKDVPARDHGWSRQTYRLPRREASETARAWFDRYPKSDYQTEVESWRVLDDGSVEFTMRRLPAGE